MKYVSPEYEQLLQKVAEVCVTPERFSKAAECVGQLALFDEIETEQPQ